MAPLSYRRHRFPPEIIQHAIWLYLRFTLSYRDVEELLAERGLDISYETVRRWVLKFGPVIARRLRQRRPRPSDRWHLDEMVVRIAGERMYLWRAVDDEGEVLDKLCHGNSMERASRAKSGHASRRCDRIAPLRSSFGSKDPQCGSGDEVALKVEGVVNRAVHAEEALGGSS
jgi:DDE domain